VVFLTNGLGLWSKKMTEIEKVKLEDEDSLFLLEEFGNIAIAKKKAPAANATKRRRGLGTDVATSAPNSLKLPPRMAIRKHSAPKTNSPICMLFGITVQKLVNFISALSSSQFGYEVYPATQIDNLKLHQRYLLLRS